MNTNQLPAVLNEYSEYAPMVDLTGACIHCLTQHTTCAVKHPTGRPIDSHPPTGGDSMNHTLIQSSDRAACSCGHWWTKVYASDSPEVAALHQRHAEAWAVTA